MRHSEPGMKPRRRRLIKHQQRETTLLAGRRCASSTIGAVPSLARSLASIDRVSLSPRCTPPAVFFNVNGKLVVTADLLLPVGHFDRFE